MPLGSTYPTTKIAIFAMTTLLAQELAKDNVVACTLTPGPALTESFKHNAAKFGFDEGFATPVELPVLALREIVTSPDPMQYAARFIDSLSFAGRLGTLTVAPRPCPPEGVRPPRDPHLNGGNA